jgi:hypothetical protein
MAETEVGVESDLASPKTFFVNVWEPLRSIEYEKRHSGHGSWTRPNDAVDEQYGPSSSFVGTPADVFLIAFNVFEELVQCLIREEPVPDHQEILTSVLAICLREALKANSANCKFLMETLANASRLSESLLTRFAQCCLLTYGSQMAKAIWDSRPTSLQTRSNAEG